MKASKFLLSIALVIALPAINAVEAQTQNQVPDNPITLAQTGHDQTKALKVNEAIYQGIGWGNTFMVTTSEGNVIIDTSIAARAPQHHKLLKAENSGPVKYIILTHGHGDHTGGVHLWKEAGARIIAERHHVDFEHYEARLQGFFDLRRAAQFTRNIPKPGEWRGNYGATIEPDILFDDKYEFTLGGVRFEIYHTPGETPDHLTVWIPQYKAAFIGDNYYDSFPNLYTLRGTRPRWALDYVNSLNKTLALKPEILLPSHGAPIRGNAEITRTLARYRDAIQHVHDETVKGMNAGKDVFTLMREIRLPAELNIGESYGKLSWSVRGIYEGYAGWFDLNPATMYETPASSIYPDLVGLAGGVDPVVKLARERAQSGRLVEALRLTEVALAAQSNHRGALDARLRALEALRDRCRNIIERGWLDYSIGVVKSRLGATQ